jgi:acetyltransferase-like isoleucine patch superfamily enzyme
MDVRAQIRLLPGRIGYDQGPRLMSWLRKRWVLLRHPHGDVRFGRGVYLGPGFSLHMPGPGTFVAGDHTEFRRNFRCEVSDAGQVRIGAGCHFTYSVLLQCSTTMDIGSGCVLAEGVVVVDGQHRFRDLSGPPAHQGFDFEPVRIADNALILSKSTVMANIGERAVVGANSVVTKPIGPYTVAVGAPARAIDYFGPADTG